MPSLVLRSNVLRSTRRLTPFESSLAKSPGNTYDQDRRGGWHWKPGIMRAVVQRVRSASVEVDGEVVSAIGPGLLCLVGLHRWAQLSLGTAWLRRESQHAAIPSLLLRPRHRDDTDKDAEYICRKILSSRLFPNAEKAWDFSVTAANREVLLVSQFTLVRARAGDWRRGRGTQTSSTPCAATHRSSRGWRRTSRTSHGPWRPRQRGNSMTSSWGGCERGDVQRWYV